MRKALLARVRRPVRRSIVGSPHGRSLANSVVLLFSLVLVVIAAGLASAPSAWAASGDFVITGRGYGHGQGMSQWGMWQGAREGNTYQQILAFYYPGTTLTTVSAVRPERQTVTVRITTSQDTFANVELTASATSAALFDSAGVEIKSLEVGQSVTLVYSGGRVQVSGAVETYAYVDLKPDSSDGRVKVKPSDGLWSSGPRQYWGYIRVLPDSDTGKVYVHNTLDIDHYAAGVSEISPDWAKPTSTAYYAPDAVKAQIVAARTFTAVHSGAVPYDDTRDLNYVGYNVEVSYPYLTQASEETAGEVLTYGGKLIATHFSSSSGGYTSDSAWSDTNALAYEPAQPDPWSLVAPPANPGYAWSVTFSPATITSRLGLDVGTVTKVEVIERDTADPASHARRLLITGTTGSTTMAARTFKSRLGLRSTLILGIAVSDTDSYEETDDHLDYSGTWYSFEKSAASGGAYARANEDDSAVSIFFSGTRLDWIGMMGTTTGKADVYLDGEFQTTIDLSASSPTYKVNVWSTGILADRNHTVEIKRNDTSLTDKYITLDAVEVKGRLTYAPPTLAALSPSSGGTSGGTAVVITGSNLLETSAVTFGDANATSFTVDSDTQLTAVAPAHGVGTVDVVVTTTSGSTVTSPADQFTYLQSHIVRPLQPGWNIVAGGPGSPIGDLLLFSWDGSAYVSVDAGGMRAGQGYWCKAVSAGTVDLGVVPSPVSVSLATGWNLVGNPTAARVSLPGTLVAFVYDGTGYQSTTSLAPGEGGWVKSGSPKEIRLE